MERSNTDVMPRCIYSHTALRGIAAASVFLSHLYEEYRTAWHLDPKAFTLFLWSWPAVDLFFMLSGFILCWVYLCRDVSPDWKDYLLARLGRILPLYYLTLIPFLATAPWKLKECGAPNIVRIYSGLALQNILLVSGIINGPNSCWLFNRPSWSIGVEFFCYLFVFPLLAFAAREISKGRLAATIFSLMAVLSTGLLVSSQQDHPLQIFNVSWHCTWLLRGIFGFSAGVFLCSLFRILSKRQPHNILINAALLASIIVFLLTRLGHLPQNALLCAFPLLVFFTAYDRGFTAKVFKLGPVQWMGERSYGIYLWHWVVLTTFPWLSEILFVKLLHFQEFPPFWNCIILLTAVLLLSELSYRYFESPCRAFVRRLSSAQL
jgi:peptidoglycan/LPS O-acetylase OafA/YrhL